MFTDWLYQYSFHKYFFSDAPVCLSQGQSVRVSRGEEARVVFIDHQYGAMKLENLVATYDPHAFLVVLAVDDVASLATVSAL